MRIFANDDRIHRAALTGRVQRQRFFLRRAAALLAAVLVTVFAADGFALTAAMLKDFRAHAMHSSASSRVSAGTS
jgi:hypothetical protein